MIVDTSVFVAMAFGEAESEMFRPLIRSASYAISAGTLLETEIVIRARRGEQALIELRRMLANTSSEIVPVDAYQAGIASNAYSLYGRGAKHPAKLNFGDCFSYALAIARDEPLLFKGDDFIHTDVRVAASS